MLVAFFIAFIAIAAVLQWIFGYSLQKINGRSMYPTLKDGEIYVVRRVYPRLERPKTTKIYLFKHDNRTFIKRLFTVAPVKYEYQRRLLKKIWERNQIHTGCWFLGDNPPESHDSRDFGFVDWYRVKWVLVKKVI